MGLGRSLPGSWWQHAFWPSFSQQVLGVCPLQARFASLPCTWSLSAQTPSSEVLAAAQDSHSPCNQQGRACWSGDIGPSPGFQTTHNSFISWLWGHEQRQTNLCLLQRKTAVHSLSEDTATSLTTSPHTTVRLLQSLCPMGQEGQMESHVTEEKHRGKATCSKPHRKGPGGESRSPGPWSNSLCH